MERTLLKSKIHRATVTDANLDYEGSLTVDKTLMDAAHLIPYEQVQIFNVTNGHRFLTYVIEGERDSGEICANGAAAHLARQGDTLIIACFSNYTEKESGKHVPQLVYVDEDNKITSVKAEIKPLRLAES